MPPRLQVTILPAIPQGVLPAAPQAAVLPLSKPSLKMLSFRTCTLPKLTAVGKTSTSCTPLAAPGPLLATVTL